MILKIPGEYPPQKVDQTFITERDGFGNCLQAAIATLFSLDIDDVVDLRPTGITQKESQKFRLQRWLNANGWFFARINDSQPHNGYYIASGPVKRLAGVSHAVVMKDGKLYHDPHPSREGLLTQTSTYLFYPLP